jgi:hypothetical protein
MGKKQDKRRATRRAINQAKHQAEMKLRAEIKAGTHPQYVSLVEKWKRDLASYLHQPAGELVSVPANPDELSKHG